MSMQFDIMITTVCNARCPFCVQEATFKPSQASEEVFLRALRKHFAEFWRQGGRRVVITGGEPLLFPLKVLRVLEVLAEYRDFEVKAVYTHGRHLLGPMPGGNQTVAEALRDAGLGCVNLSVHHPDNVVNSRIMGLPLEPTVERMTAHLRKIGLPFRLNLTLQQGGVASLDDLVRYVDWGFSLGAKDIYVRELFDMRLTQHRSDTDRNAADHCRKHLVPVLPFVDALKHARDFRMVEETRESMRDKTEWVFFYLPVKRQVFLSSLVIGTECPDGLPYLVLMPDGRLYRGWLGAEDQVRDLRVEMSPSEPSACAPATSGRAVHLAVVKQLRRAPS